MKIEVIDGRAYVYTPYNPAFVKAVKGIGGAKWDGERQCWSVPDAAVSAARMIMEDVYGYSDQVPDDTVTLKVTFLSDVSSTCSDVVLFGKVMAHARGRNSGARVGDDVAYIRGGASSGGSVKNWRSIVEEGSVAILSNVNKHVYEKAEADPDIQVEVVETSTSVDDRQKLLEEKERLLKRIAEIDAILDDNL